VTSPDPEAQAAPAPASRKPAAARKAPATKAAAGKPTLQAVKTAPKPRKTAEKPVPVAAKPVLELIKSKPGATLGVHDMEMPDPLAAELVASPLDPVADPQVALEVGVAVGAGSDTVAPTALEEELVVNGVAQVLTDRDGNPVSLLDEAELIQMVRRVIREELQDVLGERITRNIRKLVRAEINRVLTSQTLD